MIDISNISIITCLKLKINERINCLNSIDMHNNEKYTIEKFA